MTADPPRAVLTVDVENWWHILDAAGVPEVGAWDGLESRLERGLSTLLELLARHEIQATLFWLGWTAERHPELLRRCVEAGHEIASQGYAHVLAYRVGRAAFREDLRRARGVLEDLGAGPVRGFRAAGFSVTAETPWAFDEIRAAGHEYDASVFPAGRGHGGMRTAPLTPYTVQTDTGALVELPNSVVTLLGRRVSLFGGGYLRLAPLWLIRRGVRRLQRAGRPVIVYVHPREVDPTHPRLPLPAARRFKSYVGLRSTLPKLEWLCAHGRFEQMYELAEHVRDRE